MEFFWECEKVLKLDNEDGCNTLTIIKTIIFYTKMVIL